MSKFVDAIQLQQDIEISIESISSKSFKSVEFHRHEIASIERRMSHERSISPVTRYNGVGVSGCFLFFGGGRPRFVPLVWSTHDPSYASSSANARPSLWAFLAARPGQAAILGELNYRCLITGSFLVNAASEEKKKKKKKKEEKRKEKERRDGRKRKRAAYVIHRPPRRWQMTELSFSLPEEPRLYLCIYLYTECVWWPLSTIFSSRQTRLRLQ